MGGASGLTAMVQRARRLGFGENTKAALAPERRASTPLNCPCARFRPRQGHFFRGGGGAPAQGASGVVIVVVVMPVMMMLTGENGIGTEGLGQGAGCYTFLRYHCPALATFLARRA